MRLLVPWIALAGCAADAGTDPVARRDDAVLVWGPCPADSFYVFEDGAECTSIDVPLDRKHPSRGTILQWIARVTSGAPDATQMWISDGGPGGSGEELFDGLLDEFIAAMPNVDFYVPAHRGTGRSAGLVCDGEALGTPRDYELSPAEWLACNNQLVDEWGPELAQFDISNAADDLSEMIDLAHVPGQRVVVYGLSYGTLLNWRFVARHPGQIDALIQDSVVSPGVVFQSREDEYADPVLHRYAQLCAADALCGSKLGPNPFDHIAAIEHSLDSGHCAASGFDRPTLRVTLGQLLVSWRARLSALAIPYRLERCSAGDITALQTFLAVWYEPFTLLGYTHALDVNISFSEIWERPAPSPDELRARADGRLASIDYARERADVYQYWPKYPADHRDPAWPRIDVPMLMVNGDLDIETPLPTALVAAAHYHAADQTFVTIPFAPHGAGYQSPTTDGDNCGIAMMGRFIADPHAPVDTSCLSRLKRLPFEDAVIARILFGTASMWD